MGLGFHPLIAIETVTNSVSLFAQQRNTETVCDSKSFSLPAGPGGVVGDGSVSNGGLIHRVGSLTKMPNGSDHDEHHRRSDNMRSSVNHHHGRHTSVRNGMLDHGHKRPSYYKHGRYDLVLRN